MREYIDYLMDDRYLIRGHPHDFTKTEVDVLLNELKIEIPKDSELVEVCVEAIESWRNDNESRLVKGNSN